MRKYLLSLVLLFLLADSASAQFPPCVDTIRANPMFRCNDPAYQPVCGCNNVTYRNNCAAYNIGGVNNWISGVCNGFDVDLYPNPVGVGGFSQLFLSLQFRDNTSGNVNFLITDQYAKVVYRNYFFNVSRATWTLDLAFLRSGLYVVVATGSNGQAQIRKFIKS